jgi:two-component system, NarL family, sensor kinase
VIGRIAIGPERGLAPLRELLDSPELSRIMTLHAYRGLRVQFLVRLLLVIFLAVVITAEPPDKDRPAAAAIVAAYAVWTGGLALWARRGGSSPLRWVWAALLVDTVALTALTVVAGASARQTWTADLVVDGFFVIPLLAATQLRPRVTALTSALAAAAYLAASAATKSANAEPWGSILTRTFVLVTLCIGCIGLSWVQLSRVVVIGRLVRLRTALLEELSGLEIRERTLLAEQLHDGALQYVLAARMDLDDIRGGADVGAVNRIDQALRETGALLRDVVTQLHPAVLQQAGLAPALCDLAQTTAERCGATLTIDVNGWVDEPTDSDVLLYNCARELLTNVAKHAKASTLRIALSRDGREGELVVADDGVGVQDGDRQRGLAQGHVGLASLHTRVAAAGGALGITPLAAAQAGTSGTVVTIDVPVRVSSARQV